MVVPIYDPLPAIANISGNVADNVNAATDRVIEITDIAKDAAFQGKEVAHWVKLTPFIGVMTAIISILSKPLEFIVMLIGGVILATIYVFYKIFALPPLVWVVFAIWFFIMKIILLIIYTLVIGVVVVFISGVLMVIAFINRIFKGKLNKLVLCQNSPLAWYQIPNYHLGNKFERSLFCKSACATGFKPDELTGEFCNRLEKGQPSYCPQAEIMRIFSSYSRSDMKYKYADFDPTTSFMFNFMTPEQKENEYKRYFSKRQQHFNKCKMSLGNYDPFSIDICSSLDMLKDSKLHNLSTRDIARMKAVCHQGFCNSRNRFFFCGEFGESNNKENNFAQIIRLIVKFILMSIIFVFIIYFTFQFVQLL